MANWMDVAEVDDCPTGTCIERVVGDRIVALYNVDGIFHALDGVCPHQGGPLGQGEMCGSIVTCPWHGWQFDVRDGQHQFNPTIQQPSFSTRVVGSTIQVNLEE